MMERGTAKLIKECARKANVEIEAIEDTKRHIKVLVRGSRAGIVFVSVSASDFRAFKNVVTDMKRVAYG